MLRAETDGKSSIICLTSIGTPDGRIFGLPDDMQNATLHTELIKTEIFGKIKNTLKKRHQFRKIWITLTEELSNIYLDDEGNLQFGNYYLEEITEKEVEKSTQSTSNETIEKLLKKILEDKQQKSEVKKLGKNCQ